MQVVHANSLELVEQRRIVVNVNVNDFKPQANDERRVDVNPNSFKT